MYVRDFIEKHYVSIKQANPKFPILIRECSGVQPVLWARYGQCLSCIFAMLFLLVKTTALETCSVDCSPCMMLMMLNSIGWKPQWVQRLWNEIVKGHWNRPGYVCVCVCLLVGSFELMALSVLLPRSTVCVIVYVCNVCVCWRVTEFGRESRVALNNMSSDQVLDVVQSLSLKSA